MICLIKQTAGIGDICLCQKIAKFYIAEGYDVLWPVLPHLLWLRDYLKHPNITFVSVDLDFPYKSIYGGRHVHKDRDLLFLPLQTADQLYSGLILDAKFKLANVPLGGWLDHFSFERNTEKENDLFYNHLGLTDDTDYVLINKLYGTPPTHRTVELNFHTVKKVVEVKLTDKFTVFDWCKVIERASSLHFVDTSFSLLLDKLNINFKDVTIYSRSQHQPSYCQTQHLFRANNWKWKEL